jgi:DNA-binding response OmpR family regulator
MATIAPKNLESMLASTRILLIDAEQNMRKLVRGLLLYVGVRDIYEVGDGASGVEAIQSLTPDIVMLDWDLPMLNGRELLRMVRSPETFTLPHVPIIMLSAQVERSRVVEAMRLGANEYLRKPVSAKTLLDRIVMIRTNPREIVQLDGYYGPAPRPAAADVGIGKPGAAKGEFGWLE